MGKERISNFVSLDLSNVNVDDIAKNNFELKENLRRAELSLQQYEDFLSKKINASIADDIWKFRCLGSNLIYTFDFKRIKELLKFNKSINKEEFLIAVKCWTAFQLEKKALGTSYSKFSNLLSAIYITNGFDSTQSLHLFETIKQNSMFRRKFKKKFEITEVEDYTISDYITEIIDFLKFYNLDRYSSWIDTLFELKLRFKRVKMKKKKLPSFKDVLKAKMYLYHWLESILNKKDEEELLRFYPLVLWWEFTSIIPIRPLKFCKIKKDCLTKKNERYYITFPRFKFNRKGEHRTKITYDTLPIPKRLYEMFEHYIRLVSKEENSEHLLGYKTYVKYTMNAQYLAKENTKFATGYLQTMLNKFYVEVLNRSLSSKLSYLIKKTCCFFVTDLPLTRSLYLHGFSPLGHT